jgi:putative protease
VHGALCVAYSGQCLSSEAWGGRSANRGQCAQACRLPYDLIVDGEHQPLADARYLLSPGDLYALEQIPEIVSMGISALKIEGRYKDSDYVALTTRAYRKAVDEAWAGAASSVTLRAGSALSEGTNHQAVVNGRGFPGSPDTANGYQVEIHERFPRPVNASSDLNSSGIV